MKDALSGSLLGSEEVSTAEQDLKQYDFLRWLVPFLSLKAKPTDYVYVPHYNNNIMENDKSTNSDDDSLLTNRAQFGIIDSNTKQLNGRKKLMGSSSTQNEEDGIPYKIWKHFADESSRTAKLQNTQDADDIFGLMISKEIKELSETN